MRNKDKKATTFKVGTIKLQNEWPKGDLPTSARPRIPDGVIVNREILAVAWRKSIGGNLGLFNDFCHELGLGTEP